jgi:hypothetical protein
MLARLSEDLARELKQKGTEGLFVLRIDPLGFGGEQKQKRTKDCISCLREPPVVEGANSLFLDVRKPFVLPPSALIINRFMAG